MNGKHPGFATRMGTPMKHLTDNWLLRRPIAHRGLHDGRRIPENSLAAFSGAVERGYPAELDVQLLADGHIAVFHDEDLYRLTQCRGRLAEQRVEGLIKLRLYDSAEKIPLLQEVLEVVDGKIPLLIELKNEGKAGLLEAQVLKGLRYYQGEYAVQSFNPFTLRWFRKEAPEIMRGQLASSYKGSPLSWYKKFLLRNLALLPWIAPDFIGYDVDALPRLSTRMASWLGYPLLAWTIDTPARWRRAKRFAQNIIFEGIDPNTGSPCRP